MNDDHRSKPQSQMKYLMLALLFALLAILSTKVFHLGISHYVFTVRFALGWIFWFFIVVSIVCLLPIVNAVLSDFHRKGRLPKFLATLYEERAQRFIAAFFTSVARIASSLLGQLLLLSAGVLGVILLLSRLSAVDNDRIDGYVYEFVSTLMKRNATMSQSVLLEFNLPVGDCDSATYINMYRGLVLKMKEIGVKAVLIDSRFLRRDVTTLAEGLKDMDLVVIGLGYLNRGAMETPLSKLLRSSWGVYSLGSDETMRHRYVGQQGQGPFNLEQIVYLDRVQLDGTAIGTAPYHDVALELFRRYKGIPDTSQVRREPGNLIIGEHKIPVTEDGWMYSRRRMNTWGWAVATIRMFEVTGTSITHLGYSTSLFKDKIVLIRETGQKMYSYGSGERLRYGHILTNMVEGNILRKLETGHIWLSAFLLICCVFIAQRFRPLVTLILILVLSFGAVFFAAYIYEKWLVLIDIFYVILAMSFALVIFPTVAMGHKIRANKDAMTFPTIA